MAACGSVLVAREASQSNSSQRRGTSAGEFLLHLYLRPVGCVAAVAALLALPRRSASRSESAVVLGEPELKERVDH